MCGGRVADGAELREVAAGAERSTGSRDLDAQLRIGGDDDERIDEGIAHGGVVQVVDAWSVEHHPQEIAIACHHERRLGFGSAYPSAASREPPSELGPALQRRVRERLGDERIDR